MRIVSSAALYSWASCYPCQISKSKFYSFVTMSSQARTMDSLSSPAEGDPNRKLAPSCERNKGPILDALKGILPLGNIKLLEVASGTGEAMRYVDRLLSMHLPTCITSLQVSTVASSQRDALRLSSSRLSLRTIASSPLRHGAKVCPM